MYGSIDQVDQCTAGMDQVRTVYGRCVPGCTTSVWTRVYDVGVDQVRTVYGVDQARTVYGVDQVRTV